MLKKKIKALEEVDAQFRSLYEKRSDGTFQLQLEADDGDDGDELDEGKTSADLRLKEFRRENIQLQKQINALNEKFSNVDPEAYAQAMKLAEAAQNERERELMKAGKWNEVIENRQAALKAQFDKELAKVAARATEFEKSSANYKSMLQGDRVKARLRAEADALKMKLLPTASEDFYARGQRAFQLDNDGELVALDGEDMKLNAEGKPYRAKDFLMELVDVAPHLFEGANGADIGSGGGKKRKGLGAGVIELDLSDPRAMGKNIEDIAKGKITVRPVSG